MHNIIKYLILSITFSSFILCQDNPDPIIYIHPKPNSSFNNPNTAIIIKLKGSSGNDKIKSLNITASNKKDERISGKIFYKTNTIIFKPNAPFSENDNIFVQIKNKDSKIIYSFNFRTNEIGRLPDNMEIGCGDEFTNSSNSSYSYEHLSSKEPLVINGVSVPKDFPFIIPTTFKSGTSPGKLFMSIMDDSYPYIMIFESDGTPYFYRRVERRTRDFKLLSNGLLGRMITSERGTALGWEILDSNYNPIKILKAGNGLLTDDHEFKFTKDGTYLIGARDYREVENRILTDNVVQEIDEEGDVIFEWNSKDHLDPWDALNLSYPDGDYVHLNSIAVDYDNNIVISCRNQSQCLKINRTTGEVIWRLGGVKNDFKFINDEYELSYQHSFEPVPGKPDHYTVFDNGNFRTPQFSRAVEYKINTDSMTAEKIWEYRSEPDFFSGWMGNVQRLENGNTLVNWASSHLPKPTEISPEGDVVYQSSLYYSSNVYRVFKFDWEGILKVPYLILEQEKEFLRLLFNKFGDSKIEYYKVYFQEEGQMMSLLDTAKNTWFIVDYNIFKNHSNVSFFVTAVDSMGNESGYSNVVSAFVNHFEDGENLILNGDFSNGLKYWEIQIGDSATANYSVNESNELVLNIENGGENISDIKIIYSKVPLFAQNEYILEFDAFTNYNRLINISVERSTSPYTDYSQIGNIHLSRSLTHYIYKFNMTLFSDAEANLVIRAGKDNGDIILDNISLKTDNVSSAEFKNGNVKKFYLSQNYPNPFNPVTKIRYSIPDPLDNGKKRGTQNVKLIVYDVLGREVVVLVDKEQKPGKYELEWNPNANGLNLSSGIYFYKITAGNFRETRKMIFLK